MRKRSGRKGRLAAVLLSAAVLCQTFPVYSIGAAQETDGTCTHHPAHTAECGYADGMAACQFVCGECQTEQEGLAKAEQEAQQEIENVQGMIDALPDAGAVTAENLESVKAQITAIDEAKAGLDEAQQGSLVLEKYRAVVERIAAVEAEVKAARKAEEEARKAEEAQKKIENVQKMIDALPEAEAVTAEELESVKSQIAAIEKNRAGLDEAQQAGNQGKTENSVAEVRMSGAVTYYDSLNEAVHAVSDVGGEATITLLQNASLTGWYASGINGNITFVGGDYTVVSDGLGVLINGVLTVMSGTINGSTLYSMGNGIVNIYGGNIQKVSAEYGSVNIYGGIIQEIYGNVTYHIIVTTLTMTPSTFSLVSGKTKKLISAIEPNISAPTFQTWTSSDSSIAEVSGNGANATVTAKKAGIAIITVTAGGKTATCTVTVTDPKSSIMNLTITGANGDSTSGYTCAYNSTITLDATLAEQTQNILAEDTGNGTVSFYLGDPDEKMLLGSAPVNSNTASLTLASSSDAWKQSLKMGDNTIIAVFSGNDTWKPTTSSVKLTVTKAAQTSQPDKPTQSTTTFATENSITLESMSGGENGVEFGYVEGKTDGTPTSWQESPVFEKLEPGTPYTFYARYAGNDYYEPSAQSDGITLYTLPEIITDSLTATVNQTFNAQLEAKVATDTSVTWALKTGSTLPDGLRLSTDGTISGTPTAATNGSFSFEVQATANEVTNTKQISITVNKGTPSIKLEDKNGKNLVYTYGDTITLAGTITSGSQAVADKAANAQAVLGKGQAALYLGDTQLTEPVTVEDNGTFTLTYDTKKQGISATGESQTLTVKYGGNDELNAGSQDVVITLNKAKLDGSVTVFGEYVSGNKLTASYQSDGNEIPKDWTLSYQWYRGDEEISGAKEAEYTLTTDDIGKMIYVKVTGVSAWYYDTVESEKKLCKKKANSPSAPQTTFVTADSITIQTISGQKYFCTATDTKPETTSEGWITGNDGTYTFKELSANTKYVIWTYIPGDDLHIDSDMAKTSITTNPADYSVVISADSMTAGDAENIGNISVTGRTSDKIDLGYTGKVIVTAPETVILTRKDDKAQIQSALEVQRGQEWQKHHAEKTLAVFTEEDLLPVSIRFSQPKSLNGENMRAGEYEGAMTFYIAYEEAGKAQELSDSQSVKVTVTIYDRVPSRPTDGLHQGSDGELWYYKDGKIDKTFEGIVEYNGSQFYVKDGKVQKVDGLTLVKDKWYFLTEGRVQTQHTGLVQYDGEWFYITEGILDTSISGVVPYDGSEFVFTQGRLIQELNGLWLNPRDHIWYFIANGQVQRDYTGLALYDGHWFHVVKGVFDQTYTGLVLYDNAWFYVTKGELNTNISGVVPYDGGKFIFSAGRLANEVNGLWLNPKDKKWYFASNGQIQTQYTGVAMYDNEWFYIRKGILADDYNGTIQYNGATFRVRAGQLYEQVRRKI